MCRHNIYQFFTSFIGVALVFVMVLSTFNVSAGVCRVQMDGDTGKISDSEVEYAAYFTDNERLEYFKQYEGKIIRSIRITTKLSDLSGGSSRHQMVNWGIRAASNVAQAIHVDSRPGRILPYLLIKEGEVVRAQKMAEAERVLRSNKFIEDAVILIDQEAGNQVDLLVIVNDVFSLVPELGYYSPTKFTTGLVDANLAGSTNFLGVGMLYDKEAIRKVRPGLRLTLRNPMGNYLSFSGVYTSFGRSLTSSRLSESSVILKVERPYISNLFRWLGGIQAGIFSNYDYYNDSMFSKKYKYKSVVFDGWIGLNNYRSNLFNLLDNRWSILYSSRLMTRQFSQRPEFVEDEYRNNIVNQTSLLFQASIFRRGFRRFTHLFDLGRPEDIETGRIMSLTGALTRRNNHSGYYFGGEVQLSEKVGEDHFIHAQCAFGSFIEGGGVHDGKCVLAMLVVPKKHEYRHFYFRNYYSMAYSQLINRRYSFLLHTTGNYGLLDNIGKELEGDIRIAVKYEGLLFFKEELWGFSLAPLVTSQWLYMRNIEQNKDGLFALIGLGGRVRNRRLISSAFEARALYFPGFSGRKGAFGFEAGTTIDLRATIALVHKPDFLEL